MSWLSALFAALVLAIAVVGAACKKGREIPVILDEDHGDGGGAAALAMALAAQGKTVPLEQLRPEITVSPNGESNALAIVKAAEKYGVPARGLALEFRDLRELPTGSILHWQAAYFVVYCGRTRAGFCMIHPYEGRRVVPDDEFREGLTATRREVDPTSQEVIALVLNPPAHMLGPSK